MPANLQAAHIACLAKPKRTTHEPNCKQPVCAGRGKPYILPTRRTHSALLCSATVTLAVTGKTVILLGYGLFSRMV